jgi:hypothetical protein
VGALFRTFVYASLFIGFVLVYLPAQVLEAAGMAAPTSFGPAQWAGMVVVALGAAQVRRWIPRVTG